MKYELTEEHRTQLKPWSEKWIKTALRTGEYSPEEQEQARTAVQGLYAAAGLAAPKQTVFAPSPICAAIASGFAAGVLWLRENPGEGAGLFGRSVSRETLIASLDAACALADKLAGSAAPYVRMTTYAALGESYPGPSAPADKDAKVVSFLVDCADRASRMRDGGNHWAGWACFVSFFRYVAKLDLDYSKWHHYEVLASFGPRYVHPAFCVISALPTTLKVDDERRPHCATGPFCAWADGRELYYWHGTQVPAEWIKNPSSMEPSLAINHPNAEQRRCAAEIMGWDRILRHLGAKTVDENPDPVVGTLLEVTLEGTQERFLRVRCGTGRTFALPVPPDTRSAKAAQDWLWQWDDTMPKPELRT